MVRHNATKVLPLTNQTKLTITVTLTLTNTVTNVDMCNSWRLHVSCGCSVGMEQSASTDQDRLLSDNILAPNQCFPSVIWLMVVYHCSSGRYRAELEHVFLF